MAASAIAWSEFLTGPVSEIDVQLAHRLVAGWIVAFDSVAAALSADLFNRIGRRRSGRFDAMIAATAICSNARFATENVSDFQLFVPFGLRLAV